ncbi:uncharacterized protein LOC132603240 isoform X2 [Lycium barbarum]|uniref:uncharacterized protein LOC132603240 isoform X2 n=1 Tax=Lycium barbarum TaxID=112863 RepID=UPI00293F2C66|nr:uncharacterized protein LOC132603240 isoform X2 [Lycium barbarum]
MDDIDMDAWSPQHEDDEHEDDFEDYYDDYDQHEILQEIDFDEQDEADDSLHTFTGHTGELYTVACSPTDANLVATGGGDDRGFMWRIGQDDMPFELQGHDDSVSSVAFSTDGQLLASGSFDGNIRVCNIALGGPNSILEGPEEGIEWVRWHPRGHVVLAGSEDSSVWMWNADNNTFMNTFLGHHGSVTCGDFTPDGRLICTGSDDATLRIWDPRNAQSIHVIEDGLTCLTISLDSTRALTGSKDHSARIVNIITGNVVTSLIAHTDSIECVGFSASATWVATGGMDNNLIIWDLQQSTPRSICEHEDGVTSLLWLGQHRYVATGCVDGKVRIWDSLSGECVRTFSGHTDAIQSLSASFNGEYLVSASSDGTARVFGIAEFN